MRTDPRPILDMTPDGRFREPPPLPRGGGGLPLSARILAGAVLLAVVAGAIGVAALALWVAMLLIPVAILAVLIAVVAVRFQLWRGRNAGSRGVVRWR